jgi:hypothetical protein
VADPEPRVEKWINTVGAVVAPTTVLAAALYYFGYVSSRAQYKYFGVDVDTFGMGPQEYIMRSPPTLFAPLVVLVIAALLLRQLDSLLQRRIASDVFAHAVPPANTDGGAGQRKVGPSADVGEAQAAPDEVVTTHPASLQRVWLFMRGVRLAGAVVLAVGVILLLAHTLLRNWALYDLVTPLLLAGGAGLLAYSMHIADLAHAANVTSLRPAQRTTPQRFGLLIAVILACLFWAIATVAQASGLSRAMDTAKHLDELPSVILDTKENLVLRNPGMEGEPTVLPQSDGQTFHYRYHNLRLLIVGRDRMFLVPKTWSASDSTLVVPLDGSVRVQFQFLNAPP